MKKIFTSISLAVATLLTSAVPATAQQRQLSDQDKAAIVKVLVPEMLNQVKTISGIDFMALANPTIEDVISSPLFGTQSLLKAATPTAISIQPDSMRVNLSNMEGMPAFIAPALSNLKLTLGEYKELTLVTVDKRVVNVSIPGKVIAETFMGNVTLKIDMGEKTGLLPFNKLDLSIDFGTLAPIVEQLGIKGTDLISIKETTLTGRFTYSIVLGDCLRSILTLAEVENAASLPNFRINVDMTKMQVDGTMEASLKGIISDTMLLPLGDAKVYMNANGKADSTILTSYKENSINVEQFRKMVTVITPAENGKGFTTEIKDSISTPADRTWKAGAITSIATTSDQILDLTDIKSAIFKALLTDMMDFTAQKTPFTVNIITKADLNGNEVIDADEQMPVLYAEVLTALGGDLQNAKSIMDLNLYSDANKTIKIMNINVTIPMKGNLITAVINQNDGTESMFKLATMYMKSNAMEVVTDNEAVPVLEEVKVCSQNGGLYVENADNSIYSIINMGGTIVGQGRITGSSEFVSTPSLIRGTVYGFIVKKDNATKLFKFIAK